MRQTAGCNAVDMRVLSVLTAPHDYDPATGLDLGDAHKLLSLHLKGVDPIWPSHADVVKLSHENVACQLADQWQVILRTDLRVLQFGVSLCNCKAGGNEKHHNSDHDAVANS